MITVSDLACVVMSDCRSGLRALVLLFVTCARVRGVLARMPAILSAGLYDA